MDNLHTSAIHMPVQNFEGKIRGKRRKNSRMQCCYLGEYLDKWSPFDWILGTSWAILSMRFYSVKCLICQYCALPVKRLTDRDVLRSQWEKTNGLFEEVQRLMKTCVWSELLLSLPWTEVLAGPCFLLQNNF